MRLPSAEMSPAPSSARSSGVAGSGLGSAVKGVAGFCKGDRGAPSRAVFSSGVARSVTVSPKATLGDCDRARGPFFAPRNVVAPAVMSRTSCESSEHVEPALDANTDEDGDGGSPRPTNAGSGGSCEARFSSTEPRSEPFDDMALLGWPARRTSSRVRSRGT